MRVVLQRVRDARVEVDGEILGQIGHGWLALIGIAPTDTNAEAAWMAEKIASLRAFRDADGKMNLGVLDVQGSVLAISNFTLYAETQKGRRPSFLGAARPELAEPIYEQLLLELKALGVPVQAGRFGADMLLTLTNAGPVTLIVDSASKLQVP